MSPCGSGNASASDVLKFVLKRVALSEIDCKRVYALEDRQHRGARPPPSLGLGHLSGKGQVYVRRRRGVSGSTTHSLLFCQFELEQLKSLVAGLKISYYYVLQSFFPACRLISF